mgnify:CR=1 FL=1
MGFESTVCRDGKKNDSIVVLVMPCYEVISLPVFILTISYTHRYGSIETHKLWSE